MEKQNNIPKLRFPEFSDDWEVKKLGEVAVFKAGYAFKSEQMLSEKSNYQLLKMSNVYKNELRLDRNPSYWESINGKEKEFLLKEGDTILTLTGTVGKQDYGYSVQIKENNKYLLNQRLVLLREIRNVSNNDFISQVISNEKFLFYFFGEAKGGTGNQTNVGTEDVKNIQLFFPTFLEQQKIATFLSTVDEKLQALKQKKSLLETYKKGVMQKLFSQEIRFKDDEGDDFEDWEMKRLGEITHEIKRDLKSKRDLSELEVLTISSDKGFVSQKERFSQIIAGNSISKYTLLCTGEMSYNKGASKRFKYGCFYTLNLYKEALVPNVYISFSFKKEFLSKFYFYLFSTKYADSQLRQFISSSVRLDGLLNINRDDFFSMILPIPSLSEQTKIANFLTAIDEKVNKVDLQIKQTELWKKGLLQGMFV